MRDGENENDGAVESIEQPASTPSSDVDVNNSDVESMAEHTIGADGKMVFIHDLAPLEFAPMDVKFTYPSPDGADLATVVSRLEIQTDKVTSDLERVSRMRRARAHVMRRDADRYCVAPDT